MSDRTDAVAPTATRRFEPWLIAAACAAAAAGFGALMTGRPRFEPDFMVFWKAAHHLFGQVYVFQASANEFPPFGYPPTLLLALSPFSNMELGPAYLVWTAVSVFAFVAAAYLMVGRLAPVTLIAPAAVFALVTGQTTLLVGAGLTAGLALLSRPGLAGVLLGLALCVKPQVGFLLPIGLIVGGHWRALIFTGLTAVAMAALASLAFGPTMWLDWLRALPAMADYQRLNHLHTVSFVVDAGPALRLVVIALGALATALAFRKDDPAVWLIIGAGASLLCAPHAMGYDTAILAPGLLALLARRTWGRIPAGVFWLCFPGSPAPLAAFVVLCGTPALKPLDKVLPFPALRLPRLERRKAG